MCKYCFATVMFVISLNAIVLLTTAVNYLCGYTPTHNVNVLIVLMLILSVVFCVIDILTCPYVKRGEK